MKKILNLTTIFLLIFFWTNLKAQDEFNKTKLDSYFHQLEKNNKAMCGITITKDGELVYENYIGFSSVKEKIKNNSLTIFRIGSITKMFTATIIFQLIEEGRLTLDTKLSEFYPQIPNSKEITISDMLGHRSGIHSFTDEPEYLQYMTSQKSKEEMVKRIAEFESDFKPNEKYAYSNSNYVLLGYIIEEITSSTYQEELRTRISEKINLVNTFFGDKINTKSNEAASYTFQQGEWSLQPETHMSIPHGAGAIVSTPNDLTVLINALFNNNLISEKSLNQMKDIKEGYGKGLVLFPFGNNFAYGHDGGIDGFISNLAYFPNDKVALSVLANGMNYIFNDILIGVLSIYFNAPFEIPNFDAKAIELNVEELKNYEGEFSSEQLSLDITLKVENGQLNGQATGQSAFPLTPYSKMEFRFEQAGIVIEFIPNNKGEIQYNSFILHQAGGKHTFKKQN